MIKGEPAIILGDGSNLATFTHSRDFATGLMGLLNQDYPSLLGQAFNITGDEVRNWREATDILAKLLLNKSSYPVIYIPTFYVVEKLKELLAPIPAGQISFNPSVTQSLSHMAEDFESQKMWCELFDNSKLKRFLPTWKPDTTLEFGLRETVTWLSRDSERRRFDYALNSVLDVLVQSERGRYEQL
jgi:nucleoside-diphosphate-sugar epimerase